MTQGSDDNFRADSYADDDLVPFDVRDYSGRRAMWLFILSVVIFLIAAIVIFKVYQAGVRDRNAPPRIEADNSPYKVMPEDPGGEITPNQDKTVYDVMNGTAKPEEIVTAPGAETPIDLPRQATIIVEPPSSSPPVATSPTPQTAPAATTPSPSGVKKGSDYVVQVSSLRNRDDATKLWASLQTKFRSELPAGSYADIRRVDLKEKGVYYRLRVAGLDDKAAADRLCKRFDAQKQACYVTKK
ncbi:MAG: SPOR domain-containing protein [Alphaproteobacteria bacterium]